MLMPKKVKYRKPHKLIPHGVACRKIKISFGSYGLRALTNSWVTSRQIEAARRTLTRYLKKGGKVWIRIFPDAAVTSKGSSGIPMGKGKGTVDHYVAPVKKGTIMFELDGIPENKAREAMNLAAYKLPVKTKFVVKE